MNINFNRILYYFTLPFIYLISILPFPALYFVSDCLFFFLYYLISYRKTIVRKNLKNSFPDKSEKEVNNIARDFYRYFCDLILETLKTLTISRSQMLKHCTIDPEAQELFNQLATEGKNIIIVMGHKGNWEWGGNTFSLCCPYQLYVVHRPLENVYFNQLIHKMRTRFGLRLITMKDTFREMTKNKTHLNATAFIADQTPSPEKAYWMNFLNQDTPVFLGTEKIAQRMQYPIVYVAVKKIRRGYYTIQASLLKLPPYDRREGEITTAHTKRLEKDIIDQPETWLWSHRRWKHRRA